MYWLFFFNVFVPWSALLLLRIIKRACMAASREHVITSSSSFHNIPKPEKYFGIQVLTLIQNNPEKNIKIQIRFLYFREFNFEKGENLTSTSKPQNKTTAPLESFLSTKKPVVASFKKYQQYSNCISWRKVDWMSQGHFLCSFQ